jgi:RNAse (barnase) inhibitor barstar
MKLFEEESIMDEEEVFQEHITVDLTDCKYVREFWCRIRDSFGFGEPFGKNWDAFWDVISIECPAHKVTIIGANTLPESWQALDGKNYPDKIREILECNKEFKQRYHHAFDYEFIDA